MLHNRINKEVLKENLTKETFRRRTLSFYRYINIHAPQEFRDILYKEWKDLNCFGRIYVASEGINAQMSVPEQHHNRFLQLLQSHTELASVPVKYAIEDDGKSFYKLTIKVRPRIVADGLDEDSYDLRRTGAHLHPLEFHQEVDKPGVIVVDMRNHYESEIGRFNNAFCPEAGTFKEAIHLVAERFKEFKNRKILLYCTGGIRCEKASSFLMLQGFRNVNQLDGGIIEYANCVSQFGIPSKFIGKNFVFDNRLGESVDGNIISCCHQCGKPCDLHTNCANDDCHILFIQCPECTEKYDGCCSEDCRNILSLPFEERKSYRKNRKEKYATSKIFHRLTMDR
jgi:UPF0176 protein